MERLTADEARRAAIAAQGLAAPRPVAPGIRDVATVFGQISLIQIDSVNVLERSHYLPLFSRLGPYRKGLLDRHAYEDRAVIEQWGHVASFLPVQQYRLMRHRMESRKPWNGLQKLASERPGFVDSVLDEVRRRGPLTVSDLEDGGGRTGPWWGYGPGKAALEWHFLRGNLAVAGRRNFARVYDLPERVLPADALAAPPAERDEAHREMLRIASRAHGVGTVTDLADYYRITATEARPRLRELVETGELVEVSVEGWDEPAYAPSDLRIPARVEARALLSPFDSLVWERDRTERIFGFRYRIEIYTPEPQRKYGYYVLPFLLGDQLVGRIDLKADRQRSVLMARATHLEPGRDAKAVAPALREELARMAEWLELDRVEVGPRGNLARELRAVRRGRSRRYSRQRSSDAQSEVSR